MDASAGRKSKERKHRFVHKFEALLGKYNKILLVGVDNVGSFQLQKIRISLRKKAEIIMGKNSIMRMVIKKLLDKNPKLEALVPLLKGNVGMVFTNDDVQQIRTIISQNKVPAAAKSGTLAPVDVFVPAGATGLDPGQTSFFQAVNIATKIARGTIEIVNTVHLLKVGDKVTASAVALLGKLDIKPFFYGVIVKHIYDSGAVFPASILDISDDELFEKFFNGVRKLTALCLAAKYPTQLSIPHTLANGFSKLAAIALASNYKLPILDQLASRTPAPSKSETKDEKKGGGKEKDNKDDKKGGKKDKEKEKEKEEKPKEDKPADEEEEDIGGGLTDLFGGGGDD